MSFGGLGISISGMLASQVGLDVTSNNIANANTLGYSRKTLNFQEATTSAGGGGGIRLLNGTVVDKIERIRNAFLDQQVRQQNSNAGRDSTISDLTIAMNDILGEPSDTGLTAKLNQFFQEVLLSAQLTFNQQIHVEIFQLILYILILKLPHQHLN